MIFLKNLSYPKNSEIADILKELKEYQLIPYSIYKGDEAYKTKQFWNIKLEKGKGGTK